jgi:hypothetical protein
VFHEYKTPRKERALTFIKNEAAILQKQKTKGAKSSPKSETVKLHEYETQSQMQRAQPKAPTSHYNSHEGEN